MLTPHHHPPERIPGQHRRGWLRVLAAPLAALALLAFPAMSAAAINITLVRYNPPGPDTGSNASLDQEYVTVHNAGRLAKALTGWRLHDQSHHRFTFPAFSLCGHCSVRIHTGSGANGAANLYWGSGAYIWNNTGDKATLVKPTGVIRDTVHIPRHRSATRSAERARGKGVLRLISFSEIQPG